MADKLYQSKFYKIWANLKTRCTNKNTNEFIRYGERGISFCSKWKTFKGFCLDMHEDYKNYVNKCGDSNVSIDRIDNNGNYCKENCRWATPKQQANNRRSNRIVKWNGMEKTIAQWAEYAKIKSSTFRQRFYVYKWNINKCITYNNE